MTVDNARNNVRYILYNIDVITSVVKLIVHSPVSQYNLLIRHFLLLLLPNITLL